MNQSSIAALRKKAEIMLLAVSGKVRNDSRSKDELIHELQVYQIELEMQNDELRRTQARLEETSSKNFDLYEFAPMGYFIFDQNWSIIEVNLTGAKILGTTRQQLARKPLNILIHPEFQDAFHLYRRKLQKSDDPETCELKLKDNTFVSLESINVTDEQGVRTGKIRSVFSNLTDRKFKEAASLEELESTKARLAEAEEILRAIRSGEVDALVIDTPDGEHVFTLKGADYTYRVLVETMNEGTAIISHDGTISYCNQRFADIVRTPLESVIGIPVRRFIQTWGRMSFEALCQDLKGRDNCEVSFRASDGSSVPVLMSLTYFENADAPGSICLVVTDITERKRAEEEVNKSHEKLRAMTSEIINTEQRERQRIATVLHDSIAQTLGAAKMRLEMLKDYISQDGREKHKETVAMISESIRETRSIMSELSPPILNELGFFPALEWLGEQMEGQYGLHIALRGNGNLEPLHHDLEVLLFQGTRELLMNVAKHSKANKAEVKVSQNNSGIQISVKDNGIGFEKGISDSGGDLTGGFGLFNIRERLNHFGGQLTIRSGRRGSHVIMAVPTQ
jgi:PAS domain S-box-containing protein